MSFTASYLFFVQCSRQNEVHLVSLFFIEHEACAIDINELRWHCAYQGRIEARIKERVHHAGVILI